MTTIQQGVITLLRSAITGERLDLPADFQIGQTLDLVRRHSMASLIYAGALACGLDQGDPAMQELFSLYCKAMVHSEGQTRQLDRLYGAFEKAGIDYLPLKGSRMKALYPKPELRLMGDADILIRRDQYRERILPVMEGLGFAQGPESDHELVWDGRGLHLELHKCLIPSYNYKFYAYFGDGWDLAMPDRGCRYALEPDMEWIFLLTHFAKHFRDGGIGCRHVVDLWVFRRSHPDLNEERIQGELDKLGLLGFYRNIRTLLLVWFEDGTGDGRTQVLTDLVFSSGSWGSQDTRLLAQNIRGSHGNQGTLASRIRYLLRVAFPDRLTLQGKYPVLKKAPWMLPLVWLYRPFYKLLFERRDVEAHARKVRHINRENLDHQVRLLHLVGLEDEF